VTEPPSPEPSAPGAPFSWSAQPPRRVERTVPVGVWIGVVAAVFAVGLVGLVGLVGRIVQIVNEPGPPILPVAAVPVPAGELPCPQNGTTFAHASQIAGPPNDVLALVVRENIDEGFVRCFAGSGTTTWVVLVTFDSQTDASTALLALNPALVGLVGGEDYAAMPGVPGGHRLVLPSTSGDAMIAYASVGSTAFIIVTTPAASADVNAVDQIAAQQYAMLRRA
jgi:hypothetical protein